MSSDENKKNFTAVDNNLFEAILQYKCSGNEKDVIWSVIRDTIGFQKPEGAEISVRKVSNRLNRDLKTVQGNMKSLIDKYVLIVVSEATFSKPRKIKVNYNTNQWLSMPNTTGGNIYPSTGVDIPTPAGEGLYISTGGSISPSTGVDIPTPAGEGLYISTGGNISPSTGVDIPTIIDSLKKIEINISNSSNDVIVKDWLSKNYRLVKGYNANSFELNRLFNIICKNIKAGPENLLSIVNDQFDYWGTKQNNKNGKAEFEYLSNILNKNLNVAAKSIKSSKENEIDFVQVNNSGFIYNGIEFGKEFLSEYEGKKVLLFKNQFSPDGMPVYYVNGNNNNPKYLGYVWPKINGEINNFKVTNGI
ncbi:MAG: replication protein [Ignavibacteria bacterium]|jgi:hypothetical protein